MLELEFLLSCLRRLNEVGTAYMLTGSMASNFWGVPRSTHDADFVLQIDTASVHAFVHAFEGDFFIQESTIHSAIAGRPRMFNVIDIKSGLKADFWVLSRDAFEQQVFRRRVQKQISGVPVWLSTAEDIVLNKLLWDARNPSNRQLDDVAGIVRVQGEALDLAYVRTWAEKLKVAETLERILSGEIGPKAT
jgi:hypothetical protein